MILLDVLIVEEQENNRDIDSNYLKAVSIIDTAFSIK